MNKNVLVGLTVILLTVSCVSTKKYRDLENQFANLKKENRQLEEEKQGISSTKDQLEKEYNKLTDELETLKVELEKQKAAYTAAENGLKNLQASYDALEKNSNQALQANMNRNRELLAELQDKEKALATEQDRLNNLKKELESRSRRVDELEGMIAAKEANMRQLKETLSNALNSFEGKGLTVEHKNGKVYVSVENKLLFNSGSWAVGVEGRRAVTEIGKVLADNPDLSILIEGHTDNDAYRGSGPISDNWDLSTKRATAIVNILVENKSINPQNLTAAGRGEFVPLVGNNSPEGKSKNRRIEIILTPKLDEISKLLNEI